MSANSITVSGVHAAYGAVRALEDVSLDVKFGKGGEWAQSRVLQVQFQHIKGNAVDQFRDISTQVVVAPDQYKSGSVIYPYEKAKE